MNSSKKKDFENEKKSKENDNKSKENDNKSEEEKENEKEKENEIKKKIQLAIEDAKKYYQIYYANPNPLFINQLRTQTINILLSNYSLNDILVIKKILQKYSYFNDITLTSFEPQKKNKQWNKNKSKDREPVTEGEKNRMDKEKRAKEIEKINMINKIIIGIGKNLSLSGDTGEEDKKNYNNLQSLTINYLNFDKKLTENLSKGIINNNSIKKLNINNCQISLADYEILLKGLLNHEKIEYLNLSNNNFGDEYGNMIGRIIARQTFRRDQDIWLCGIRNEKPKTDKGFGLVSININGNKLSKNSAECITTALASDQYIRSITMAKNNFDKDSCKKFIYLLRKNLTLLNIDLRDNPGYDENIKYRLVVKMSKNIHHLYNQFKKKIYTEKEFNNFTKFIDTSFFNLDIPKDIIKEFKDKNEEKIDDNIFNNIINKKEIQNKNLNNEKKYKINPNPNSNSNSTNNKTSINLKMRNNSRPNSNSNIKNIKKGNTRYNLSENKNNKNKRFINNNQILRSSNNNKNFKNYTEKSENPNYLKNYSYSGDKNIIIKDKNKNKNNKLIKYNGLTLDKNLLKENLLLKRKIIEFKAKEIQNKLGKNIIIPDKYDNNNLKNNFNVVNDLLDILNNLMGSMKKDNKFEINHQNKNIINNQKFIEKNYNQNNNNILGNNNNNYTYKMNNYLNNDDDSKEKKDKFSNIDYQI